MERYMSNTILLTHDHSSGLRGLTETEAAARLKAEGFNELPAAKSRNFLATMWEIAREPMILLLIGAGVIYLFLGELRDSLVLLISIFVVLGINLYQQRKTDHALEALRDLSSPRAMVVRDGQQKRIAGREVVRQSSLGRSALSRSAISHGPQFLSGWRFSDGRDVFP